MMGINVAVYELYSYLENGTGCRTTAMAAPLFLTNGVVRCEAALHIWRTSPVCLFYTITVFWLLNPSDMMYETRRKRPEPTLLLTQTTFNLQHHMCMV